MEGQPPIHAGEEPRSVGAHIAAFTLLVRMRDVWIVESQEHEAHMGRLQGELDETRVERDAL